MDIPRFSCQRRIARTSHFGPDFQCFADLLGLDSEGDAN
jgi:hypothetical protein